MFTVIILFFKRLLGLDKEEVKQPEKKAPAKKAPAKKAPAKKATAKKATSTKKAGRPRKRPTLKETETK